MADYDEDFNNLCVNDLCINEYDFEKTSVIRPPEKKNVKLAQRFIFIDSADFTPVENTFTIDFGETINNVVEIELMSCQLPKTDSTTGSEVFNYPHNYILLFLDNLELANYRKISAGAAVQNCFTRLIIPQKTHNIFFGRIKNFTNTYEFKPKLQKLSKLTLRFTNRSGEPLVDGGKNFLDSDDNSANRSVQLTFAITYQTEPDLFD
tara:strand:- start:540 stop:1160 length:621 start_codon:yes stop_codon:yes gene_type:complete